MALPDLFRPGRALRHRGAEGFTRPFDEMRRMMEDFWMTSFEEMGRWSHAFSPRVDVKDDDNQVLVSAELPGIDQKDLDAHTPEKRGDPLVRGQHEFPEHLGRDQRSRPVGHVLPEAHAIDPDL